MVQRYVPAPPGYVWYFGGLVLEGGWREQGGGGVKGMPDGQRDEDRTRWLPGTAHVIPWPCGDLISTAALV